MAFRTALIDDMRKHVVCLFRPAGRGKAQAADAAGPLSRLHLAGKRSAILFTGRRIAARLQGVVFDRAGRPSRRQLSPRRRARQVLCSQPVAGITLRAFGRCGRRITAKWNGWRRR